MSTKTALLGLNTQHSNAEGVPRISAVSPAAAWPSIRVSNNFTCRLPMNVVAVTQPSKLLLASCVPAVEADLATIGGEIKWPDLHADRLWEVGAKVSSNHSKRVGHYMHTADMLPQQGARCCTLKWSGALTGSYFFSNSPVKWRFTKVVLPAGTASSQHTMSPDLCQLHGLCLALLHGCQAETTPCVPGESRRTAIQAACEAAVSCGRPQLATLSQTQPPSRTCLSLHLQPAPA